MLEALLKRDRLVIALALALLTALAWWAVLQGAGTGMSASTMTTWQFPPPRVEPSPGAWNAGYWLTMLAMWCIMMIAMMLPSVTPTVLAFASVHRKRREEQRPFVPTGFFLAGYLLAWAAFSLIATLLQALFHHLSFMSPTMESIHHIFAAMILLVTGIFQFTSFKKACLIHCQNPLDFVITKWKEGKCGALRMGVQHGLFCIGCCWLLMALLFVVGVMNLLWVAILALFVLLEKLINSSEWLRYVAGGALILWAIYVFNP